jgi:hypothetical protein
VPVAHSPKKTSLTTQHLHAGAGQAQMGDRLTIAPFYVVIANKNESYNSSNAA